MKRSAGQRGARRARRARLLARGVLLLRGHYYNGGHKGSTTTSYAYVMDPNTGYGGASFPGSTGRHGPAAGGAALRTAAVSTPSGESCVLCMKKALRSEATSTTGTATWGSAGRTQIAGRGCSNAKTSCPCSAKPGSDSDQHGVEQGHGLRGHVELLLGRTEWPGVWRHLENSLRLPCRHRALIPSGSG